MLNTHVIYIIYEVKDDYFLSFCNIYIYSRKKYRRCINLG